MEATEASVPTAPVADPHAPRPYWNPYLAGFGLGLVLLSSFVIMGRGLGGSSAFAAAAGVTVSGLAPEFAKGHSYFADYAANGMWKEWLVWQVIGVFFGGLVSGILANRARLTVEKGPRWSTGKRLVLAFFGGSLMAVGAKLASGCTSGQALTGGSLLNAGSWIFMGAMFGAAYAVAWFLRKQWT